MEINGYLLSDEDNGGPDATLVLTILNHLLLWLR